MCDDFTRKRSERKFQFVGIPVSEEYRKINLQRQLHFHQPSHPDFPATEPDDRVNEMAGRAVHIAEVNPEKSEPLGSDAEGIKKLQPLIFKGCAVVVTVGLEPTVSLHFARSVKFAIGVQTPWSGACTCCSLRFRLRFIRHWRRSAPRPIDVFTSQMIIDSEPGGT